MRLPGASGYDPEGDSNSIEGGVGSVYIRGWAFDRDEPSKSVELHVYIGNTPHLVVANAYRPDVNNIFGTGNYHGYETEIKTGKSGYQDVSVYAINIGDGNNVLLGTSRIYI